MPGAYMDHLDPRLRSRVEPSAAGVDTASDNTRPPVNVVPNAQPIEAKAPAAVSQDGTNENGLAGRESDKFKLFVDGLLAENETLARQKAAAIKECASIQKEHVATHEKLRDANARYMLSEERRVNQEGACARRAREKIEALNQVAAVTKKNAELLKFHAELGEESVWLKSENARLVREVQPRDELIKELQAENASLKEVGKLYDRVKEERDILIVERDALRLKVQRRDSHSTNRSRSPRRQSLNQADHRGRSRGDYRADHDTRHKEPGRLSSRQTTPDTNLTRGPDQTNTGNVSTGPRGRVNRRSTPPKSRRSDISRRSS